MYIFLNYRLFSLLISILFFSSYVFDFDIDFLMRCFKLEIKFIQYLKSTSLHFEI